jgi:hypothetical protein
VSPIRLPEDHEHVQELLAAQALGALDEGELPVVESELARHLPGCTECREALDAFRAVAGELGLAAEPQRPPRTLAARLRREVRSSGSGRRARFVPALAAGSAAVLVAGLLAWGAHLTGRVTRAEDRQIRTTELLTAVTHPRSRVVPLSSPGRPQAEFQLAATFIPGRPALYLFGSMPSPTSNRVYQLWLSRAGQFSSAGTFVPEEGHVLITFPVDPTVFDGLLITEEPQAGSSSPSERRLVTAPL